jgi:hypothetical protein
MKYVKYCPLLLFFGYSIKLLAHGASPIDAAILLVLGSISFLYEYKSNDNKLKELELRIDKQEEINKQLDADLKNTKSFVNSMKLGASLSNIKF